jgi:N-methylhydantoinase A
MNLRANDGARRLDELAERFHAEHRRLYSYDLPNARVELVNLRVTAIGGLPERAAPAAPAGSGDVRGALVGERPVYFRGAGFVTTPCYARERLAPGMRFDGPAVVDQEDATILVAPGFRARIDAAADIIMEKT